MKFKVFIYGCLSLLHLSNCKEEKSEYADNGVKENILDSIKKLNNIPIVYDENYFIEYDQNYFPNFKSNDRSEGIPAVADSMQQPYYNLLYIGLGDKWYKYPSEEYVDTIGAKINSAVIHGRIGLDEFENIRRPDLEIFVDTTQYINNKRMYSGELEGDSYPVYIINRSNLWEISNIDLSFPILMQALNRKGEWQHIEYHINGQICPGLFYVLPPNSYYVTSARKYGGDFKTKFRLKLKQKDGFIYSNEFYGFMNKTQFIIPHLPRTDYTGKKDYSVFLE